MKRWDKNVLQGFRHHLKKDKTLFRFEEKKVFFNHEKIIMSKNNKTVK